MKISKLFKKLISVSLVFALVLIAVAGRTTVQAATESTSKELGTVYLNSTNKYLHLGREDSNKFEFRIKASMLDENATYTWYVKEDKGNPNAVTIDALTGVVTAQEAGRAYIRCKITLADKTVLRPEARVTVRNNISEVDISNMPENNTITINEVMDFNRSILNTEAGKDKAASGITRWELAEDNAGVNEVSDRGLLTPTEVGTFMLRAVSFQSLEKYNLWLNDKEANVDFVTASSKWYEVTVVTEATDVELATEAIRGLFVDVEAPNDEKALVEGVTQAQLDQATALVDKLTDENSKIIGHAAIAIAQELLDVKLATEAIRGLFVDVEAPNDEKALAEGVTQAQLDEATALVDKLTDENSKIISHAAIAIAQELLNEKLANEEEAVIVEEATKALEALFVDISAPNDEKALAEGVTQAQIDEAEALVNKVSDVNSKIFGLAVIDMAQGLLDLKLADEADAIMIENAIKALEGLFVNNESGTQKELAEGVDQAKIDETADLVNRALDKAQELLDRKN